MLSFTPKAIRSRYDTISAKQNVYSHIKSIAVRYAIPFRDQWNRMGSFYNEKNVFDSTARHSTMRFADRIFSSMTPPESQFMHLVAGKEVPEEMQKPVGLLLDAAGDHFFHMIKQTNFFSEISECFYDLAAGEMAMMITDEDDTMPCTFTALNPTRLVYDEGASGHVEHIWWKDEIHYHQLQQRYPDAIVTDKMKDDSVSGVESKIELLHYVAFMPDMNKWMYYIVYGENDHLVITREYEQSPVIIERFKNISGTPFGFGPLMVALPDIRTLNKIKEYAMNHAALELAGIMTAVDDGVLNPDKVVLEPGTVIPVAYNAGPNGRSLDILPRGNNFDLSMFSLNDLQASVRQMLYDFTDAPLDDATRSATEVRHRQAKLLEEMGPTFGRVSNFLRRIMNRSMEVMAERGDIPPMVIDGKTIDIGYNSPIAHSQAVEDLNAIAETVDRANQIYPGLATAVFLPERIGPYLARKMNVPEEVISSPEEIQKIQQDLAAAQQESQGGPGETPPSA